MGKFTKKFKTIAELYEYVEEEALRRVRRMEEQKLVLVSDYDV